MMKRDTFLSLLSGISEFLLPRTCRLCGCTLSDTERYACSPCLARMPRTLYHRRDGNPMEQRFAGLFPFEHAAALFHYSRHSDIARLVHDFKYRQCPGIASYLGEIAGNELYPTGFLSDIDVIVPVPMHFIKKARRGYNQTEHLAEGMSRASGIPVDLSLRAVRPHRTQTRLSAGERRKNLSGIFRVRNPQLLDNRRILLVDDICTTGATLVSASEAILAAAPGAKLSLFTLCVTF